MAATADHQRATLAALLSPSSDLPHIPPTVDGHALRLLCLQSSGASLPPWTRALAWQAMLSYLPSAKSEWRSHLAGRRAEYYQFVRDFLPLANAAPGSGGYSVPGTLSERDVLLDSVFNDINHSLSTKGTSLYHDPIPASASNPLAPAPKNAPVSDVVPRMTSRWMLLHRLSKIHPSFLEDFAEPPAASEYTSFEQTNRERFGDVRWHSLLRILYIFSLLNPSIGYIQGMHDAAAVFLYVFGQQLQDADAPEDFGQLGLEEHVEADVFWCFSALMSEVRDLFDFDGIDHGKAGLHISNTRAQPVSASSKENEGISGALKQFSVRLRWLDQEVWSLLCSLSLDPRLPLYSFRWFVSLLSTELRPRAVALVWDNLLAETGARSPDLANVESTSKIDFLIDVSCAMLATIRDQLFAAARPQDGDGGQHEDSYRRVMMLLLNYPRRTNMIEVTTLALSYRQRRLTSSLTGDAPRSPAEVAPRTPSKGPRSSLLGSFGLSPAANSWLQSPSPSASPASNGESSFSSMARGNLSRYATQLSSNDTVSNLSRKGSVWAAKALQSWNRAASPSASEAADSSNSNELYTVSRNGTIKPANKGTDVDVHRSPRSPHLSHGSPSFSVVSSDDSMQHSKRRSLLLVDQSPSPHRSPRMGQSTFEEDVGDASNVSNSSGASVASSLEGMFAAVRRKHSSAPTPPRVPPKQLMLSGATSLSTPSTRAHTSPTHLARGQLSPHESPGGGSPSMSHRAFGPRAHARGESASTFSSLASLEEEGVRSRRDSIVSTSSRASDRLANRRAPLGYNNAGTSRLSRTTSASRRVGRPSSLMYQSSGPGTTRHEPRAQSISDNTIATFLRGSAFPDLDYDRTSNVPPPSESVLDGTEPNAVPEVSEPVSEERKGLFPSAPALSRNDTIKPKLPAVSTVSSACAGKEDLTPVEPSSPRTPTLLTRPPPSPRMPSSSEDAITEDALLAQLDQDDDDFGPSGGEEDMLFTTDGVTKLSARLAQV